MTFQRLSELRSDPTRVREMGAPEIVELLSLALAGFEARDPGIHNHPLHLLVGKIPDFDQGWTPEQKLSWFDGMAKLLQAAS